LGNNRQQSGAAQRMKGTMVETAPGKWRLRVFVGRDAEGRVQHKNKTFAGTRGEAQKDLAKLVADVKRGQVAVRHPGSVSDLLDRWLCAIEPERSAYTVKEYRRLAKINIGPALGSTRLDQLAPAQIDAYYASLLSEDRKPKPLSTESVRRHHFLLHAALGRAVKWGLIASNPADRATPPGLKRSTVNAPSAEEVHKLISAAESDGDSVLATAIALAAVTGCRRGELCALRWSDVNWGQRILRFARSVTVIRQQITDGPTKSHGHRNVALDDALSAMLAKRRSDQELYAEQSGIALSNDPFILSRRADGSQPCLPNGLTAAYRRVARSLGLSSRFHELRHFMAITAITSGADVRTVAGRLGQADPSVTLRVYAHALEQRDRDLGALLGNAVLGPPTSRGAALRG
jgi:integrase